MTFWIVLSILLIIAFIFIIYNKSKEGKFHTTDWNDERLKKHLFVLPVVLLLMSIVTLFYWMVIESAYGDSPIIAIIDFLLCLGFIIWQIVFLKKPADSIKSYVILSCLLTLFTVILFWYSKLSFEGAMRATMCSTSPIIGSLLSIATADDSTNKANCMSASFFILVSILQFYYIRWISFYYRQESPVGYSKSYTDPNVKTFGTSSTATSEKQTNSSVKTMSEQLMELKQLLDEGVLTQDEFEAEKKKILNN